MTTGSVEIFDGEGYLSIPGTPGQQTFAQFGPTPPTARAVGDMWMNTSDHLLEWDDDWTYPPLLNGWTVYGPASYGNVRYRKAPGGLVLVEGMITGGVTGYTAAQAVFILPTGYRPQRRTVIAGAAWAQAPMRININGVYGAYTDGAFSIGVGNPANWTSVHCSFVAEAV